MGKAPIYRFAEPHPELRDFVFGFSALENLSGFSQGIITPNGRIDLLFTKTAKNPCQTVLMGLETKPKPMPDFEITSFFAISFNPLALEYILHLTISDLVNSGMLLPEGFWGIEAEDLNDFDHFQEKVTSKILSLLPGQVDERKRRLFNLIFATNGELNVHDLTENVGWGERQINRYFNQQLGIALKTYCNILRFQASLSHIKEGRLYPELNFTDQSHFIKEIRKLSGVSPKELFKNENDRFLQLLVYGSK